MSQAKLSSKKRAVTTAQTSLYGILEQMRKYVDENVQFPNDATQLLLYIEGRKSHLNKGRSVLELGRATLKEKLEELFEAIDEDDGAQATSADEYAQRAEKVEDDSVNLTFKIIERLEELNTQQRISAEIRRQTSAPPSRGTSPPVGSDRARAQAPASSFRLPEIALPTFDGEVAKFAEFWSAYEQAVHANPAMTAPVKLQYLRTLLKGQALTAVRSQPFTEEGYRRTVELIRERFGSDSVVREELLKKLMSLQPSNTKASATLLNIIEDLVCKLRDAGEPVDNQLFVETITRKFNNDVIERVIEARLTNPGPMSAENLMTILRTAINYLEMKDKFSTQLKAPSTEMKKHPESIADRRPEKKEFGQKKANFQPNGPGQGTYQQPAGNPQQPPQPRKSFGQWSSPASPPAAAATNDKCFVCDGAHSPSSCPRPMFAKRDAFRFQKRCYKCTATDHRTADCQKGCSHCQGAHHVALCIRQSEEMERKNVTASVAVPREKESTRGQRSYRKRQYRGRSDMDRVSQARLAQLEQCDRSLWDLAVLLESSLLHYNSVVDLSGIPRYYCRQLHLSVVDLSGIPRYCASIHLYCAYDCVE